MRRSVVITTLALAVALAPAAAFAQTPPAGQPPPSQAPGGQPPPAGQPPAGQPPAGQPPAGQPPAGQPPAGQPPAAAAPAAGSKEPRLSLTGPAGAFMYVIKPDQTATFEELMGKVREALAKSENPVRKQQLAGLKGFKAAEPSGANVLYIVLVDPTVPAAEYDPLVILAEGLGTDCGHSGEPGDAQEVRGRVRGAQSAESHTPGKAPDVVRGAPGRLTETAGSGPPRSAASISPHPRPSFRTSGSRRHRSGVGGGAARPRRACSPDNPAAAEAVRSPTPSPRPPG